MSIFGGMETLNLNHLLYFWTVVNEGTVAREAEKLLLTQPTVSTQLRQLERSLGQKLFGKSGRHLELTDFGRTVFQYADDMFAIGRELLGTIKGHSNQKGPTKFVVGIVNVLPKMVAYRLLEPAMKLPAKFQFVIRHGHLDELLLELAAHSIDLVLSDCPVASATKVRAFSHQLGESPLTLLGTRELVKKYGNKFPASLNGAPLLLPGRHTSQRRQLDHWFDSMDIRPDIRGEIDDSALMKVFGQVGEGLFFVPTVVEADVCRQFHVELAGRLDAVHERFYALSGERKLKHPAVVAISNAARSSLFNLKKAGG